MRESNIKFYSLGMVAENKKLGSDVIQVIPIEVVSNFDDEVTSAKQEREYTGVDAKGQPYTVRLSIGKDITATWDGDTNRVTAPDVRRGERVNIYRDGDSGTFRWESTGRWDHMRRLETVVYRFSANPNNRDREPDDSDSYTYEVSTHTGHVTFRTSMMNQEKAMWTTQYNLADGVWTHEDEKGNVLYVDSVNTDIMFRNADDSYIQLIKDTININTVHTNWFSKDIINIETKDLNIKCQDFDIYAANNFRLETSSYNVTTNDLQMEVSGKASMKASSWNFEGTTYFKDMTHFTTGLICNTLGLGGAGSGSATGAERPKISGISSSPSRVEGSRASARVAIAKAAKFAGKGTGGLKMDRIEVDELTVTGASKMSTIDTDSITWSSSSGPLPS